MFRRLGWLIDFVNKSESTRELSDAKPPLAKVKPVVMLEAVQEVAVYIHRFHNLDLFQQGWYQLRVTVRWEGSEHASKGFPAKVVQYQAPSLGCDEIFGAWTIDDTDNSFSTQPFRIKYARQDILLSIMVAFNLHLPANERPPLSSVILKFELLYAPTLMNGYEFEPSPDDCPAAIHEFRIPPKALLGLHSYCPIHFDAFHAVLVDVSVHVCLLKAGSRRNLPKEYSTYSSTGHLINEGSHGNGQTKDQVALVGMKHVVFVRALLNVRDTLLDEIQKLSNAIHQAVDLTEFMSKTNDMKILELVYQANLGVADGKISGQGKRQNGLEREGILDSRSDGLLLKLHMDGIVKTFHNLGDQVLYLWNTFLKFHRENNVAVMEYLRDVWANDRRAEWSIWMVYTKVDMPHHYINSSSDDSSNHGLHRRGSITRKLVDDPAQTAAMRAELHRRSVAQMRINNQSIQDLHIFGDPSKVPIVTVERVLNAPRRTFSDNSYMRNMELVDSTNLLSGPNPEGVKNPPSGPHSNSGRDLKIVVFVHGFQGHHLDLRLVRNQWLLIDPKIEFLMSEINEDRTSGDFKEMGERLAHEVVSFIKRKIERASRSGRLRDIKLSFVGHSIGNIIIRTALAESIMEPFLRFLYTYVSVSGPHLGYLYSSNSLFNSGLWLMKKLKGTQCIHQLTFTDDPDLRNTFLYKLCKKKTLQNFKHMILLSSPQDGYVPYHSARIESCRAASVDNSKKGKAFLEMLNNCLDQIRAPSSPERVFIRCDVNFDTSAYGRNLNSMVGRAAHIEFLESDIFARFIMWSFPEMFR